MDYGIENYRSHRARQYKWAPKRIGFRVTEDGLCIPVYGLGYAEGCCLGHVPEPRMVRSFPES